MNLKNCPKHGKNNKSMLAYTYMASIILGEKQ